MSEILEKICVVHLRNAVMRRRELFNFKLFALRFHHQFVNMYIYIYIYIYIVLWYLRGQNQLLVLFNLKTNY